MKLIIDSRPVELPSASPSSFSDYCREVMRWLLRRNRAIQAFSLDGRPMLTVEQAEAEFPGASTCEILSVPLREALNSALGQQVEALRSIEEQCERLVTDSLLAEPHEIARQWQSLCEAVKREISHLPQLAGLLTDEEVDELSEHKLAEFNAAMRDIAQALNRADVVGFSDILELRLLPWLVGFRELVAAQLASLGQKLPVPQP